MNKITIRATKLETFWTCPYRYKFEPESDEDAEHFRLGSALHKYIELALHNTLNEITEGMILNEWGVKQRLMIIKMANLALTKVKEKEYSLVCSERTNKYFFEDINIKLQGTYDHLFKNKVGELVLVDMKTAASKRDDEHKQAVRQNVIYPALVKLKNLLDIKYFEYWVMTKTSNPTIEDICFEVTADPVLEVKAKLDELRQAEEDNIFPPKRGNYSCFWCKCRDVCRSYSPGVTPTIP